MKNLIGMVCAVALALSGPFVLTGCGGGTMPLTNGGGGNNGGGDVNRSVRQQVIDAVQNGFSTHKTGKGSGRKRTTRGEDPSSGVVYDNYYELWAKIFDRGYYTEYFEDEACTKPAGFTRSDIQYGENGSDFVASGSYEITAGPKSGWRGNNASSVVSSPEYSYIFSYFKAIPDVIEVSTSGSWDSKGGSYKETTKDKTGKVSRYECSYKSDGTSRVVFTDENSLEFTLNFNAGQSGSGTVTGADTTLLPATIVWDETGSGTITFKDGSKETFEDFQFRRS